MTLIEVMLVLAIMVAMGAVIWPSMAKALEGYRIRKAADQLVTGWNRARVQAMDTGLIHAFRCRPGEGMYQIEVWASADVILAPDPYAGTGFSSQQSAEQPATELSGNTALAGAGKLPEGIHFAEGQSLLDNRAQFAAATAGTDAAEGEWSAPILFYPDGTSSNALVALANESGKLLVVELRGITGTASIGQVMAEEMLR